MTRRFGYDDRCTGGHRRGRHHGRLARLAPDPARLARRRAPGEERADRRLDLARGGALHPLRAQRDRHGDAGGVGAPVPGRAAGRDRRDGRVPSVRRASRHPVGRADGRVPPRAGAGGVPGPRVPHPHSRGAGPHPSAGAHRRPARRHPRAGRRPRRPDPRDQRAGRRRALSGRRDPATRAGAGDRMRRVRSLGGPYRPGHDSGRARGQRRRHLVPGDRRDDGAGSAGGADAAPVSGHRRGAGSRRTHRGGTAGAADHPRPRGELVRAPGARRVHRRPLRGRGPPVGRGRHSARVRHGAAAARPGPRRADRRDGHGAGAGTRERRNQDRGQRADHVHARREPARRSRLRARQRLAADGLQHGGDGRRRRRPIPRRLDGRRRPADGRAGHRPATFRRLGGPRLPHREGDGVLRTPVRGALPLRGTPGREAAADDADPRDPGRARSGVRMRLRVGTAELVRGRPCAALRSASRVRGRSAHRGRSRTGAGAAPRTTGQSARRSRSGRARRTTTRARAWRASRGRERSPAGRTERPARCAAHLRPSRVARDGGRRVPRGTRSGGPGGPLGILEVRDRRSRRDGVRRAPRREPSAAGERAHQARARADRGRRRRIGVHRHPARVGPLLPHERGGGRAP